MLITHAQMSFTEIRRQVQAEALAAGERISNRKSKALAQAIIDKTSRDQWHHNTDNFKNFNHTDPVGEKVVRRVMAMLAGYEPEPIG
ncbi:hypothetical protein ACFP47_09435 [Nesterenkonia lacusekhoensis]|uniref:Uncharacterized protein n=1 Tax=Nesterenkonia lacusekhoensis TaxID=150832 RepID=A0ABS4SYT9_9MICC|nr:hypothetical protein [Nesterenkonia lacusekhoensis]MBP2317356.1 hypothetical protein [Nesterenkonia lacusekhoensis]